MTTHEQTRLGDCAWCGQFGVDLDATGSDGESVCDECRNPESGATRERREMTKRRKASETVNLAVRVPADLARAFESVAVSEERTVSAEIRRLMRLRVAEKHGEDRYDIERDEHHGPAEQGLIDSERGDTKK